MLEHVYPFWEHLTQPICITRTSRCCWATLLFDAICLGMAKVSIELKATQAWLTLPCTTEVAHSGSKGYCDMHFLQQPFVRAYGISHVHKLLEKSDWGRKMIKSIRRLCCQMPTTQEGKYCKQASWTTSLRVSLLHAVLQRLPFLCMHAGSKHVRTWCALAHGMRKQPQTYFYWVLGLHWDLLVERGLHMFACTNRKFDKTRPSLSIFKFGKRKSMTYTHTHTCQAKKGCCEGTLGVVNACMYKSCPAMLEPKGLQTMNE